MKVTAPPPTLAARSLQEICQAARQANCGECWQQPGKPARATPKATTSRGSGGQRGGA